MTAKSSFPPGVQLQAFSTPSCFPGHGGAARTRPAMEGAKGRAAAKSLFTPVRKPWWPNTSSRWAVSLCGDARKETWQKWEKPLFHRWQNRGRQENKRAMDDPVSEGPAVCSKHLLGLGPCAAPCRERDPPASSSTPHATVGERREKGTRVRIPQKRCCLPTGETSRGCSEARSAALALPAPSAPGIWGWPQPPAPLPVEGFLAESAPS